MIRNCKDCEDGFVYYKEYRFFCDCEKGKEQKLLSEKPFITIKNIIDNELMGFKHYVKIGINYYHIKEVVVKLPKENKANHQNELITVNELNDKEDYIIIIRKNQYKLKI